MHVYRFTGHPFMFASCIDELRLCWQSVLVLLYDRCPTISFLMPTRWGVLLFLSLIVRTQATCSDTLLHQKPDHYKGKGSHTGKSFWDGTRTKQNAGNYWRAAGSCCPNPPEGGHTSFIHTYIHTYITYMLREPELIYWQGSLDGPHTAQVVINIPVDRHGQ